MTNAMLMRNTLTAAQRQARLGVRQASRVSTVAVSPTPLRTEKTQASSDDRIAAQLDN
jgi:hypothetical protein